MSTPPRDDEVLGTVAGWLAEARRVTVLTGAGVSTDSGIPDYRGPNGLWRRDPSSARTLVAGGYRDDPDVRRRAWAGRSAHGAWTAEPNAAHRALVDLERSGRLRALVTQNIDGLHQAAGSTGVLELHGTIWSAVCLACGARTPMVDQLARVRGGEPDPACLDCGGVLGSATVGFGQPLDPDLLAAARDAAAECDVFLALGSSLRVQPAAGLCRVAVRAGARLVVVNADPTPYDELADAVLREPIGELVPALVTEALALR
ncbi:MAG: NAD-dependent deacetylase [Frankiales bacterium]|jgi:NAD-dependent deacetylase|nr:NAD-dependent deacetylase [Frankiales bacterium]